MFVNGEILCNVLQKEASQVSGTGKMPFSGLQFVLSGNTKADAYPLDGLDLNYGLLTEESNDILTALNRYVWTVTNQADAIKMERYNVYGITTDKPDILK